VATLGVPTMSKDDEYAVDVIETMLFSETRLPDDQVRTAWNYVKTKMKHCAVYEWKWGELVETTAMRIAQGVDKKA